MRKPAPVEPIQVPAGRITAITPSARSAGRFDLVIDGTPAVRLSIQGIERLKLRTGDDIDVDLAAVIAAEAEVIRVYDRALAQLAARGRATGELRRSLIAKGETPRIVDDVLLRLDAAGFLDDAAYSRQFARARAVGAGLSRRRIETELIRRGVARGTATQAIADAFRDEAIDESASLQRAAEKKMRTLAKADDATRRRRLYSFLARRGYDLDDIRRTVDQLAG